uniref:RRM domain-containing protein n=1 Tax=Aegilops tauschii subsp. strangulata TaxID=200361 RepID=A0A453J5Y8_AEGTS
MAAEDQIPRAQANPEKTKKRKKPKKDKWGQPIAAAADEPAVEQVQEQEAPEEPVAAAAAAAEGGEGAGSYERGKVVASGMPYTTTEEEIRELFDQFGPIRSLQLSRFPDSGNFRGLAFVTFESDEVAMKSLELDGSKM